MKPYTVISEKNLPESELELEIEISYETLARHRTASLKKISDTFSMPGFRAGHVPENLIIQKIGELQILKEAAYVAIEEVLPDIFAEKKLAVIGEPQVSITKIAIDSRLGFKVIVSVLTEIILPDYKKIAAAETTNKTEEISVSEKELNDFIDSVRKRYARSAATKSETPASEKHILLGSTGETLPELTDEFVKKLGDFKSVEDFKVKMNENLAHEKAHKKREKKRLAIAEAILEKTKTAVAKSLIENELAKMLARFHDDVSRMGMKLDEYLKNIKKTEEDLKKDWRKDAEKHAKLQLVLTAIAEKEKIEVPKEAVEHEVKHLLEQYKDADPNRARAYLMMMLANEKVFEFLELQKQQ